MRMIFVTPNVWEEVEPPHAKDNRGPRQGQLRQAMDDFICWGRVRMGRDPYKKDGIANMAPVAPLSSRLFDFRCSDNNAGMRCFGFFLGTDVFLALSVDQRETLDSAEVWKEVVTDCKEIWEQLFSSTMLLPHKEDRLDAYATKCALV